MNSKTIGYWASTGLTGLTLLAGGASDLSHAPSVVAGLTTLGYPAYVASILGAWKLLGAAAILAPRLPRLKEWAYAGILFDLTGASVSHAVSGDTVAKVLIPLVLLSIAAASWALRPESRKLAASSGSDTATMATPREVALSA